MPTEQFIPRNLMLDPRFNQFGNYNDMATVDHLSQRCQELESRVSKLERMFAQTTELWNGLR